MPKATLNTALIALRGRIDGFVYKQYHYGTVVTRVPDMTKVKPSKAQLAHRQRMREAAQFHRQVLKDPALLKKYQRIARQSRINLSAATMGEVLRLKK
jgi:hypothetical protein